MLKQEIKVVINNNYGGFSICEKMAHWLRDNKAWTVEENPDKLNNSVCDLNRYSEQYYYLGGKFKNIKEYDIEFRTNEDLIECVETLKKEVENLSYFEKQKLRYEKNCSFIDLKVEKVIIDIKVEDLNDGCERIVVLEKYL